MARINIMASKKIISKIAIVGFDESEASLLLSFLFNYDVDFKKKTDKEITDQYPLCKNIWDSLNNMAINLVKTKDVPNNERQLGKFSIIAVKYRTKKQTLFYHLRNAIAHANFQAYSKNSKIEGFSFSDKDNFWGIKENNIIKRLKKQEPNSKRVFQSFYIELSIGEIRTILYDLCDLLISHFE